MKNYSVVFFKCWFFEKLLLSTQTKSPCFLKKNQVNGKMASNDLRQENAIAMRYLNYLCDFWVHTGHKQPQNEKFELGWVQAKFTQSCLNSSVGFFGGLIDKIEHILKAGKISNPLPYWTGWGEEIKKPKGLVSPLPPCTNVRNICISILYTYVLIKFFV